MPIYAYRCAACGHTKDVLRKLSDPPLDTCPACGATAFEKQVTAAGFQLKGSGWYVTDFKNSGNAAAKPASGDGKPAAGQPADAKGDAASGGGGKGDAAPAASAKAAEPTATPAGGSASASGGAASASGGSAA